MDRTITEIERLQERAEKEGGNLQREDSRALLNRIKDYKSVIKKHKNSKPSGDDWHWTKRDDERDEELYQCLNWK